MAAIEGGVVRTPIAPSPTEPFAQVREEDDGEELPELLEALLPLYLCETVVFVLVV